MISLSLQVPGSPYWLCLRKERNNSCCSSNLVGVDDQVVGLVGNLVHEGPLQTRRETSTTSSSESRRLHFSKNPIHTFVNDVFGSIPVSLMKYEQEAKRKSGKAKIEHVLSLQRP